MKITFIGLLIIFICAAIASPKNNKSYSDYEIAALDRRKNIAEYQLSSPSFDKSIWIKFDDKPYQPLNLSENEWIVDQVDPVCHN